MAAARGAWWTGRRVGVVVTVLNRKCQLQVLTWRSGALIACSIPAHRFALHGRTMRANLAILRRNQAAAMVPSRMQRQTL